jgi:hypothetical protein
MDEVRTISANRNSGSANIQHRDPSSAVPSFAAPGGADKPWAPTTKIARCPRKRNALFHDEAFAGIGVTQTDDEYDRVILAMDPDIASFLATDRKRPQKKTIGRNVAAPMTNVEREVVLARAALSVGTSSHIELPFLDFQNR